MEIAKAFGLGVDSRLSSPLPLRVLTLLVVSTRMPRPVGLLGFHLSHTGACTSARSGLSDRQDHIVLVRTPEGRQGSAWSLRMRGLHIPGRTSRARRSISVRSSETIFGSETRLIVSKAPPLPFQRQERVGLEMTSGPDPALVARVHATRRPSRRSATPRFSSLRIGQLSAESRSPRRTRARSVRNPAQSGLGADYHHIAVVGRTF